jgi:protein tyrosine kinase
LVVGGSVRTIHESDLGDCAEIGSGGMAKVYALKSFYLPEAPSHRWVYKKFRPEFRPIPLYGMNTLVQLLDGLAPQQRQAFDRSFNWPARVVVDDHDGAAGVILPLLPVEYFVDLRKSSGTTKRKAAEMQFLFADRAYCTRVGIAYPDEQQRRALCRSLTYAMGLLDRADVVYGDLSARNVLFRVHPRPAVMLVDCDAVRPKGARSALGAQPHSPDWEPPEAIESRRRRDSTGYTIQSKQTDRYKLGLAILRILTPGPGCSTNIDPVAARPLLPSKLYQLLQQSLSHDPAARPTARTWHEEFTR